MLRILEWVHGWPEAGDALIWVDVEKADAAWRRDDFYIPPGAPNHRLKYDRFGQWLATTSSPIQMPHVTLRYWTLSFTDGRHRFAWLRDQGAQTIAVTTDPKTVERMARVIGSMRRETVAKGLKLVQTST